MSQKHKGILLIFALLTVMSVSVVATEASLRNVTLDYYGNITEYKTKATTVDTFLYIEDIALKDTDTINLPLDTELEAENEIIITEGVTANLVIDGESTEVDLKAGTTIGNVIGSLIDETNIQHIYDGGYADLVEDGGTYEISTKRDDVERHNEIIPFETEYVEVDYLEPNEEEIVTYGLNGTKEITTTKSMFGTEVLEETTKEEVLIEPVSQVVNIGAQDTISTPEGDFTYSNVITMKASAYTAGYESTGKNPGDAGYGVTATGIPATKGVVAVDPNVIPLGSKVYIDGYGVAVAGDTGGAIKGNKIDLCYDNLTDALNFGRRTVDVYVLD